MVFQCNQLGIFRFLNLAGWDSCPESNDFCKIRLCYLYLVNLLLQLCKTVFCTNHIALELCKCFIIHFFRLFFHLLFLDFQLFQICLFGVILRDFRRPQTSARTAFIHQVNRFIRQETVCDIPFCQSCTQPYHCIWNVHTVVLFIILFNAVQNLNGIFYCRFFNGNWLETPFQCSIFFNILPIFFKRGCTDYLHFATGQRWLQDVRSIHRPLGVACSNQVVQFINKENDVAFLLDFVH